MAKYVVFVVAINGRSAHGYISCSWLTALGGRARSVEDWVVYRRHQAPIDAAVARRATAEGWDTVMVRRAGLLPDA